MLKILYDNKTDIPENLASFYAEKDGKFVLQADGLKTDADVQNIKEALDKERKFRRDAESKVKEYEVKYSELGDDFDINEYHDLKNGLIKGQESAKEIREKIDASYKKQIAELQAERDNARGDVEKYIKTGELQKAMIENNIGKPYMTAVEAMLRDKVKVEEGKVFMDERPIGEALKDWANSEDGKHYVSAPQNTGGGANGKSSSGTGKTMARSEFDALPAGDRASFFKEGGKLTD